LDASADVWANPGATLDKTKLWSQFNTVKGVFPERDNKEDLDFWRKPQAIENASKVATANFFFDEEAHKLIKDAVNNAWTEEIKKGTGKKNL